MNRICNLFGITYPIIQGGMVWCSGWQAGLAVSKAGGLGLLAAGLHAPRNTPANIFGNVKQPQKNLSE